MTETKIPQSTALAEANPESLEILLSRDPEGYGRKDRDRIVDELIAYRARYQAAETAGTSRPRLAKASELKQIETSRPAEELGL